VREQRVADRGDVRQGLHGRGDVGGGAIGGVLGQGTGAGGDEDALDGRVVEVPVVDDDVGPAGLADGRVAVGGLDGSGHVPADEADGDEHDPQGNGAPRVLGTPAGDANSNRSLLHGNDAMEPAGRGHPGCTRPAPRFTNRGFP
jgi:hypothetical protein